ncbi:MAG: hypothetical protein KA292_10710 [Sphingorhabdus sp.]|nr:hypothetical protein [Sphingorhabdus sp.]
MRLALSPDSVVLPLPVGLSLRSVATRKRVGDELTINVTRAGRKQPSFLLKPVPSGHWVSHQLPGFERDVLHRPADWVAQARGYRFEVDDPAGRYLPIRFEAPLPARKAVVWPGWRGWGATQRSRAAPVFPADAGASYIPDYLPLFSAPGARPENGMAQVRAQLAIRETGGATRNAGWAAVTVGLGTRVIGLGIADAEGRVCVSFPYPALPQQSTAEAADGREQIVWDVRVRVYCSELTAALSDGEVPELGRIFRQLAGTPLRAMATIMGSQPALPDQKLSLGQPPILRTALAAGAISSTLFLKSP